MEFVKPKVYKLAETKIIDDNVVAWLTDLDGVDCLAHVDGTDGEKLVELAGRRCYDDKTEVLTNEGWKKFKNLSRKELVATYNTSLKALSWEAPLGYQDFSYKGDMIELETRDISLSVTPDHRLLTYKTTISNEFIEKAETFLDKKFYLKHFSENDNTDREFKVEIPSIQFKQGVSNKAGSYGERVWSTEELTFSLSNKLSFLKFISYFIAEGTIYKKGLNQKVIYIYGDHEDELSVILKDLGLKYSVSADKRNGVKRFSINNSTLAHYLDSECGHYSYNKKFPSWIYLVNREEAKIIWDVLIKTDGTIRNGKDIYITTSKTLKDQCQALLVKLGFNSSVSTWDPKRNKDSVKIKGNHIVYNIRKKEKKFTQVNKNNKLNRAKYNGRVYCVSTYNGIVVVRRNDKIHFNGNCYKSFKPGLNPNVTRMRTDSKAYHENILKIGHGSILEHTSVSFAFENVSRVFTHELVRHRAGTAMSQESLRYVRLTDINVWVPEIFRCCGGGKYEEALRVFTSVIKECELAQRRLAEIYDIENMKDFGTKKKLTSAFRRVAPIGLATGIVFTANLRSWRHIIEMRTSEHAEEELRLVFGQVAEILQRDYPFLFGDYDNREKDELREFSSDNRKI